MAQQPGQSHADSDTARRCGRHCLLLGTPPDILQPVCPAHFPHPVPGRGPGGASYCFVPIGATEAEIRAIFGDPDYVLSVSASEYQNHIEMRRRTGNCTLPSRPFTDRAVLYLEAMGIDQMEAYYFIDDNGRLAATFISED